MCGRNRHPRCPSPGRADPRRRRAFTLVEILMAMMVSGIILSAVVTLSYALGNYQNEGDGLLALSTNGRFVTTILTRDVHAARAMAVSSTGALVLWMGDIDADGQIDSNEIIVYYRPNKENTVRRLSMLGAYNFGAVSPATFQSIINTYDAGSLLLTAEALGLSPQNDVVCRSVDSVAFYANRAVPQTKYVEFVLALSCAQNVLQNTGRTVTLKLYDMATMRTPYEENGFAPQT